MFVLFADDDMTPENYRYLMRDLSVCRRVNDRDRPDGAFGGDQHRLDDEKTERLMAGETVNRAALFVKTEDKADGPTDRT